MNWSKCRWVRYRLPLLAGASEAQDLHGEELRAVQRHLLVCGACRAKHEALNASAAVLARVAGLSSPTSANPQRSLWSDLEAQIQSARRQPSRPFYDPATTATLGMAASLLAVGITIGTIAWHLGATSAKKGTFDSTQAVATAPPRTALPPNHAPSLAGGNSNSSKPLSLKVTSDVEPRTASPSSPSNLSDPQRSQ